jgi:trans-aconitate 2-methyltransferase
MAHEFDGRKYEKASSHQKQWGNKIISEFRLAGNETILDLGCGDGKLTENLADLVPDGGFFETFRRINIHIKNN